MTVLELYEDELRLRRQFDELMAQQPPPPIEQLKAAAEAYTTAYWRASRAAMAEVEPYRDI